MGGIDIEKPDQGAYLFVEAISKSFSICIPGKGPMRFWFGIAILSMVSILSIRHAVGFLFLHHRASCGPGGHEIPAGVLNIPDKESVLASRTESVSIGGERSGYSGI